MSDRVEYDRTESYREGGELVRCAHCGGSGTTQKNCCQEALDMKPGWYDVKCCACNGVGKIRM